MEARSSGARPDRPDEGASARSRIQERNRALILAGMSHDLRTQVTRLRLRLELLPEGTTRDKAIGDLEAMQELIEQSLEFAAMAPSPEGASTDLSELTYLWIFLPC